MADITYPNGVGSWQTLYDGIVPKTSTVLGSVELGDGNPLDEQGANLVVFDINYTDINDETSMVFNFQVTADGTTWSTLGSETITLDPTDLPAAGIRFRKMIRGLSPLDKAIRVTGICADAGTADNAVTIRARLGDIYKVITITPGS
jgi:hypothetical protein